MTKGNSPLSQLNYATGICKTISFRIHNRYGTTARIRPKKPIDPMKP